jgi:3-oxoadipate enol-lactonase
VKVEVGGVELAYAIEGEARLPAVVLLHALGENSGNWTVIAKVLAATHRVYALDLRGHGASSRPETYSLELMRSDLLGFLDAVDLGDVSLVGHSLGAAVAYLVA